MALLLRFHVSQTNTLRINSKCCSPCCVSTQPTPGCVTWRRQRPETARSARHTRIRRAHTAHPQTFTPTGATGLHHARHVPLPLPSVIHGHPALRLYTTARGWSQARNREPTPQQAHSEKAGPPCVAELRSTHMLNRPVRGDIPERWVCEHGNTEEGPCSTNSTSTCILGYQAEREVSASAKRQV